MVQRVKSELSSNLGEPNELMCSLENCTLKFDSERALRSHKRRTHKVCEPSPFIAAISPKKREILRCNETGCDYVCSLQNTLNKHKVNVHGIEISSSESNSDLLLKCSEEGCHYICGNKGTLDCHRVRTHGIKYKLGRKVNNTNYKCPFNGCNYACGHRKSLDKHRRDVHKILKQPAIPRRSSSSKLFECPEKNCHYSSSFYSILLQHRKQDHGILFEKEKLESNIFKCGFPVSDNERCFAGFPSRDELFSHLAAIHNETFVLQTANFNNFQEFLVWKNSLEYETRSKFIQPRGSQKGKKRTVHVFECHRSGKFVSDSKGLRTPRTKGTNKIEYSCSAFMKVVQNNETLSVQVTFCPDHYGHDFNICRLPRKRQQELGVDTKKFKRTLKPRKKSVEKNNCPKVKINDNNDDNKFGIDVAEKLSTLPLGLREQLKAQILEMIENAQSANNVEHYEEEEDEEEGHYLENGQQMSEPYYVYVDVVNEEDY